MTNKSATSTPTTAGFHPERQVLLHPLVYLRDGDEVTVGRSDLDAYIMIATEAAEVLRRLGAGDTPRAVAAWYEHEHGERIDIGDFVAALDELGFVRSPDEPPAVTAEVRWRRLGAAAFSAPAWVAYGVLAAVAAIATVRHPELRPSYHNVFFTHYYALIELALFIAAVPQLILHESFHALAGRRLGIQTKLTIGRRLYFVVLETAMDGLVTIPRRRRYLPILAGMLADVLVVASLTIAADLTRQPSGALSLGGRICLAVAVTVWVRLAWQFYFYLRTDLYVLVSTVLGCVDLHATAIALIRNRVHRLLGRHERVVDESTWHRTDRKAARWYSWLVVVGYTVSIATFVFAAAPIGWQVGSGIVDRFTGGDHVTWAQLLDSAVVAALLALEMGVLVWVVLRDRRRAQRRVHHVAT